MSRRRADSAPRDQEQPSRHDRFSVDIGDLVPLGADEMIDPAHFKHEDEDEEHVSEEDLATFFDAGFLMEGPDTPMEAPADVSLLPPLLGDADLYIALVLSGAPLSREDREYIAYLLEPMRPGRPRESPRRRLNKALRAIILKKLVRDEGGRLRKQGARSARDQAIVNISERFKMTEDALRNAMKGR